MCAPAALSLGAPPHSSAGDWQHPRHKGSAGGAEEATTGTHARASRGFCWRPRGERGAARGEDGALHEVLQHSRLRTPKSRGPTNSFVGADRRTGRGTGESLAGDRPMLGGTQTRKKARRVSYLLREEEGRFPRTRAAHACHRALSRQDRLRLLPRPPARRGAGRCAGGRARGPVPAARLC